jgi:hypothetical protein
MKEVFSPAMVAHVWAQQGQDYGRNSGTSFYFSGKTIYSYGSHFPIATFVNLNTVLMTTRSYSSTTAKHIGRVRQAIPDRCKIIYVHIPSRTPDAVKLNLTEFSDDIARLIPLYQKARQRKDFILCDINDLVRNGNAYAELVKSKKRFKYVDADNAVSISKNHKKAWKAKRTKEANERKRIEAERTAHGKKQLNEWASGKRSQIPYNVQELPVKLRVKGDTIETSHGADFPLKFGKRAYLQAKDCKDNGKTWETNGKTIRLGHFQIDSIDATGTVTAGCHVVEYKEILRIAKKEGWV